MTKFVKDKRTEGAYDVAKAAAAETLKTALTNKRELTDQDRADLVALQAAGQEFMAQLALRVKPGRYFAMASRGIEEALTWANKSIYTEGGDSVD